MNGYQCIIKLVNLMKWFETHGYDNMYNYTRLLLIEVLSNKYELDEVIDYVNDLTFIKKNIKICNY